MKKKTKISEQSSALQVLKKLYLQNNRRKYPSLPEGARVIPAYRDKDANGLTKCIVDFLHFKGHQAERIAVTGRYMISSRIVTDIIGRRRRIGSDRWIKSSMQPGAADISAVINGKAIKIEVKIGRDQQSQPQKYYQHAVEQAGGVYFIARNFEQFFDWYLLNNSSNG
jgi:hypothetical protein